MQPLPLEPGSGESYDAPYAFTDVGDLRPGSELTRWVLARYLLGRAVAVQVNVTLIGLAVVIAVAAGLTYYGGAPVLAVLIALVAVAVLLVRALVAAVVRHTTMAMIDPEAERRLRRVVAATRADVGRELRRIGLPGRPWSMPLLLWRLLGRRRAEVRRRLREFDIDRVIPVARLDELHMVLAATASRSAPRR